MLSVLPFAFLLLSAPIPGDEVSELMKIFSSFISDEISNFNTDLYYQNPNYLEWSYREGKLLDWSYYIPLYKFWFIKLPKGQNLSFALNEVLAFLGFCLKEKLITEITF